MKRIVGALWIILAGSGVFVPVADAAPLRTAGDRPADILHLKLDLNVNIPLERARGTATIRLRALRDLPSVRFDAVDFDVRAVTVARNGGPAHEADFINDGESITVLFDRALKRGEEAVVTIAYSVTKPKQGLHFFHPTVSDPDTPYQVWSQGESIENRYWVPCFDHPNEMQTTEMIVTVEEGYEAVSNGRLISKKDNGDGTVTFHWLQDQPHVAYLITLVVGKFHVAKETWRGKPVLYYVPPDKKEMVQRTFEHTVDLLEYFSNRIGVEYPWDKYAQICAEQFGGGMENTSATTLGSWILHDERAHLDYSADGLIAHEMAHQWFGDLVTCRDWAHVWLNEGFASFMEPVWYEHHLGKDEYDYAIYQDMQAAIRGGKKRPIVDRFYEDPDDMFDSRAYPKGSSVLHMLRRRVGDELFWTSVRTYLTRYAHQPVETWQFRRVFEEVTGRSLERFFYDWTERPGAPELEFRFDWDASENLAELAFKQTQKEDAFEIPVEVEFRFDEGEPIVVRRTMTGKSLRVWYPLPSYPRMVLLDPRDAVLKELTVEKDRPLWEHQLFEAPYVTARIRAAKHFGKAGGEKNAALLGEALQQESFWGVGEEIAKALGKAGGDAARDALLKGLALKHPKVRRACVEQLASFHQDEKVIAAVRDLLEKGDPSYRVEAEAIRTYGKLQPDGAVSFLMPFLKRDSHRDQIRAAVLTALGDLADPQALPTLIEWSTNGKQRFTRSAAVRALGKMAEEAELSDEQIDRIVELVTDRLRIEKSRWLRGACLDTLEKLRRDARSALPVLREVAANDPERRVRKRAKAVIKAIRQAEPPAAQVDDLAKELESLKKQNRRLRRRLEKLEGRLERGVPAENKVSAHASHAPQQEK